MVDPAVMSGVPCVRGTRVPAATIVGLLVENVSIESVLEHYPQLTAEDVHACQAFIGHLTHGRSGGRQYPVRNTANAADDRRRQSVQAPPGRSTLPARQLARISRPVR